MLGTRTTYALQCHCAQMSSSSQKPWESKNQKGQHVYDKELHWWVKNFIENPLGPKCPAAKVTDEHVLVHALRNRYQRPYFYFILWIKSVSNVYNKMIWYTSHSEMNTRVELMNIPSSLIVTIFYVMRTPKIHSWKFSKITHYSISNHGHHGVHYIFRLIHPT